MSISHPPPLDASRVEQLIAHVMATKTARFGNTASMEQAITFGSAAEVLWASSPGDSIDSLETALRRDAGSVVMIQIVMVEDECPVVFHHYETSAAPGSRPFWPSEAEATWRLEIEFENTTSALSVDDWQSLFIDVAQIVGGEVGAGGHDPSVVHFSSGVFRPKTPPDIVLVPADTKGLFSEGAQLIVTPVGRSLAIHAADQTLDKGSAMRDLCGRSLGMIPSESVSLPLQEVRFVSDPPLSAQDLMRQIARLPKRVRTSRRMWRRWKQVLGRSPRPE